jgi:two-component system sensor histidine kinase MtrB
VPAEDLPHLFDRFYKTDAARRGGSGLGLAIARQHARSLGGELSVRSGAARGLVFELRVPVAESLRPGDGNEKSVSQPEGEDPLPTRRTP